MWNTGGAYSMSQGMAVSGNTHLLNSEYGTGLIKCVKAFKTIECYLLYYVYTPDDDFANGFWCHLVSHQFLFPCYSVSYQECKQLMTLALSLVAVAHQFPTTTSSPLVQTCMHVRIRTHTTHPHTHHKTTQMGILWHLLWTEEVPDIYAFFDPLGYGSHLKTTPIFQKKQQSDQVELKFVSLKSDWKEKVQLKVA